MTATQTPTVTICLGWSYANDTEVDEMVILSGWKDFKVEEIEVFEINNYTTLQD
jgi:hypothetical protein